MAEFGMKLALDHLCILQEWGSGSMQLLQTIKLIEDPGWEKRRRQCTLLYTTTFLNQVYLLVVGFPAAWRQKRGSHICTTVAVN